jgi:4-amino-4-deoxy-L-arabinose transferase-like glycosyltransferase
MTPQRLPSVVVTTAVAVLLALHWWLAVSATFEKSATSDETVHLTGGYSYWRFNDYRLQPENGNLPQRWAALPLLIEHPHLDPAETPDWWSMSHVWLISHRFLYESGNNTDFMLATTRGAMALWSVATGLLVFGWSRRWWGDAGGLFSLVLYVFSATTLAHGPLVTSDMTVTFFLLAATGAFWRHLQRLTVGSLLLSLVLTALTAVAKFSFLLLLPVFGLLVVWRLAESVPWVAVWHGGERRFASGWAKLGLSSASVVLHGVAAWAVIWAFFGFRYTAFAPGMPPGWKFYLPWQVVLPESGFWQFLISHARQWQVLPEAFLQGFSYMRYSAEQRGAFLNGAYSTTGWVAFFPYAFLVKTFLAELGVFALAGSVVATHWWTAGARRLLNESHRVAPLLVLFTVYGAFSLASHLNIGHRHILPIYPILFIAAGVIARPAATRWLRLTAVALAGCAVVESMAIRPHYLAYFNVFAGGPANGWRHLIDSSLDWGQDLQGLARWLRSHQRSGEVVYLANPGMSDAQYEGIPAEPLAPYYYGYKPRRWQELKPGIYCVCATELQDVYSPFRGPWTPAWEIEYQGLLHGMRAELATGKRDSLIAEFGNGPSKPLWDLDRLRFARLAQYLRLRRPDAMIGYSILIYRLSAEEVHAAVDGSPAELADLMERALKAR